MSKLKAAVIGLGKQRKEDHIPGLLDSQLAQLQAISDIDEDKLKEWQEKLGVRGYRDCYELLGNEELDFIVVATPHDVYEGIIEEATKRGVHILKEKPFARNLREAFYFKELCDRSGIQLTTTLQRRFNPIYTTFFQLKDQIGDPLFVEARYTLVVDDPHNGWRGSRERAGGGCIIDMGYHIIDMIIWYFGLPTQLHAEFSTKSEETCDVEDTASILFSYDNDLYGSLIISRHYPPKTETIKVLGSRGIIEVERGGIRRLDSNGELLEHLRREQSWPVAATNQIDYFCKVIREERENMGNPEYHLQHASFIEACYESKKRGGYVNPMELLESYER